MTRTIIRLNSFMRAEEFDRIKKEWEQENPDTCLIPYTMKLERGRAKWRLLRDNKTFTECKCSNCGAVEYFNHGWKLYNYCPNCGAEMEVK